MYRDHVPLKDIATALGWHRNRVKRVLKRLHAKDGIELPDGRSVGLRCGPSEDCVYVQNAEEAHRRWMEGESLRSIGRALGICDLTAMHAIEHWCRMHDLPIPTTESRRWQWIEEAAAAVASGTSITAIASRFRKSTVTIRGWVSEWYAKRGEPDPDLRTKAARRRPAV